MQACSRSIFSESRSLNHVRIRTRFTERKILRLNDKILAFFRSNLESQKSKKKYRELGWSKIYGHLPTFFWLKRGKSFFLNEIS